MARILVIEDEKDIQDVLDYNLRQAGHKTYLAATGQAGLAIAREKRPDVILLDLMLPDLAGTEVCRALKQDSTTRDAQIIMVTAKGEEVDRVVGFELGADDYVTKPFSVRELLLRVQAVLRRVTGELDAQPIVTFGDLKLDRDAHRAWVREQEVELTALEFKLLVLLYDRRNRVQSRAALLSDVWALESDNASRTVDTHVKRLREKLGTCAEYIQTVRGVGYRFVDNALEAAP